MPSLPLMPLTPLRPRLPGVVAEACQASPPDVFGVRVHDRSIPMVQLTTGPHKDPSCSSLGEWVQQPGPGPSLLLLLTPHG